MKHPQYSILSLAIFAACYSGVAVADLREQCLLGVPHFQGEVVNVEQTDLPVYIEADSAVINQPKDATYMGDVSVKQGNRSVIADKVEVELEGDKARKAYLHGDFDYRDNYINAKGKNASLDLLSKDAVFGDIDYQLVGRQGRGKAENVSVNDDRRVMKKCKFYIMFA